MKDLRNFIDECTRIGEIEYIEGTDSDLELGTIAELMSEKHSPAPFFSKIKGYSEEYRIIANVIEEPRRASLACNLPPSTGVELVRRLKDLLNEYQPIQPKYVTGGPVLENRRSGAQVNMLEFPAPRWHEKDGGRYLGTGDIVVLKDPTKDWVNLGTYRIQVHGKDTLGIYISSGHHGDFIRREYWKKGESCPVVISFGHHPILFISSFLQRPWGTSEYDVAGYMMDEPIEVIKGPATGLPIPAHSELAIEGEIPPPEKETHDEGPFGEWPGYYATGLRKEPVVKVKSVFFRDNPIIFGAAPLKPPSTHGVHFFRGAAVWSELDRTGIPGIQSVYRHPAGGTKFFTVISIKQMYPGHAKHVALASMSGSEGGYASRYTVIVDEDIDPTNLENVVWAICTRCDPKKAIDIMDGCWTAGVDPLLTPEKKEKKDLTSSRAIIYACKPYEWINEFPPVSRASEELRSETRKKWRFLGRQTGGETPRHEQRVAERRVA